MSFIINQGFSLKSPQFNFERDYFKDVATLKAASEDWFPNYFITNVGGVLYQLDKNRTVDTNTGRWRQLVYVTGNHLPIDTTLSTNSTNAVQNKVVTAALNGKASTAVATTSANGLLSAADKTKLDGIATGANKTVVDTAMNANSGNPVANRIIVEALTNKADKTVASQTANGLLSAADKKKLDGIASGGTADSAIDNATIDKLFA